MKTRLNKVVLKYLYIRWVIFADISLTQASNDDFRTFLQYIYSFANRLLFVSDVNINSRVLKFFLDDQQRSKYLLHSSITFIHITCDVWTFLNYLSILRVVAHFANEKEELQALLLLMTKLQNLHSDQNQALIIEQTFQRYDIRNKLSYFVMSNTEFNDTFVNALS